MLPEPAQASDQADQAERLACGTLLVGLRAAPADEERTAPAAEGSRAGVEREVCSRATGRGDGGDDSSWLNAARALHTTDSQTHCYARCECSGALTLTPADRVLRQPGPTLPRRRLATSSCAARSLNIARDQVAISIRRAEPNSAAQSSSRPTTMKEGMIMTYTALQIIAEAPLSVANGEALVVVTELTQIVQSKF
jgi:hypothetical protein